MKFSIKDFFSKCDQIRRKQLSVKNNAGARCANGTLDAAG